MTTKSRIDEDRLFGGVARIAYPIEEAAMIAGVARTRMFEAVRTKKITARKAGRATIIEHDELLAYVQSLPTVGKQLLAIALIEAWIALQSGAAIEMMAGTIT
jgi:hypothetical protein